MTTGEGLASRAPAASRLPRLPGSPRPPQGWWWGSALLPLVVVSVSAAAVWGWRAGLRGFPSAQKGVLPRCDSPTLHGHHQVMQVSEPRLEQSQPRARARPGAVRRV